MPAPPLAVSSQSKKKLQAFQFQPQDLEAANKENANTLGDMHKSNKLDSFTDGQARSQPEKQQEQRNYPQTPASRIPFSDLIADPEDALSRPINATPIEQIEWKTGPGSSDPSCSARSAQRRRKRARSSSPTAERGEMSKHFDANNDPLDLESISRSLRTPRHEDPLSLLWDNFAGPRGSRDHNEPVLPPLPPMSSSPNTPGMARKDDLRRTASCGIEWPTSSSKKRKLSDKDPFGKTRGIFAAKKDAILAKNASNQSKVSILVDSIHQSLINKVASEPDPPSSSSPLPERSTSFQRFPLKQAVNLETIDEQRETVPNDIGSHEIKSEEAQSSEFGDMDLDPDDPELLDALQAATQGPTPSLGLSLQNSIQHIGPTPPKQNTKQQSSARSTHADDPFVGRSIDLDRQQYKNISKSPVRISNESLDDFDSFEDDDGFATELAELANKVDSQNVANLDGTVDSAASQIMFNDADALIVDKFEDDFDDDHEAYDNILTAIDDTTSRQAPDQSRLDEQICQDHRTIKRYLVQDVFESHFTNSQGRKQPEKVLSIKPERLQQMYVVHLRQSWYDTRCIKGSYIHLIGNFDQYGSCIVDDNDNMVILHPDHLISATTVADSFSCIRRATLQDRVKATSPAGPPLVYGQLIHEVFGQALKKNKWDSLSLRDNVEKLIPSFIESLYEINARTQDAVEYVMSKMPELTAWASIFVTGKLDHEATIRDRNGAVVPMAIDKLLELEEHVWSPMYGLKGNIDATVQIQMQLPRERDSRTLTVPLELKTGKRDTNEMHRAQTALYTLLLSDRYDINVTSGILYYLETSKTFRIEGIRNEIRHMIIQRNELACYVHDKLDLPPMVKREHLCKKCFAQNACFTYHKLIEGGDGETSGMKDIFNNAVGHLKSPHQEFFRQWDDLLTKEERDAMKFKRELWTMLSTEREALGRCFSNVVIEPGSASENSEAPKINRYTYSFVKHKAKPGFSFAESQITAGEPIVISDEVGHFALAIGFVTNVRPTRITVVVDRRLQNARQRQPGFNLDHNQVFSAIMEVNTNTVSLAADTLSSNTPTLYRIDKDEFATGMATARNNILRIMEKDLWRARELRHLIIDKQAPAFKQVTTAYALCGPASQQSLNVDQRKAIEKVMSAKDYALVLGMPGTGKTTTIAHIIRALVLQGKSVLLTSYTHTAVDNILLKIRDDNIPILRLGSVGKVHPDVASFADLSGIPKRTIAELEASWTKSKVVATTCLGINHPIFNHRKFDYCIVDEASQITLPVCLGPIRLASTFILVGDHYQLPPLVQNKEAQEGGLDMSLFKLLSDAQPASVVSLEHQYRMADDIMLLSNHLVYNGRLKCGTPAVASRILQIPNPTAGLEAHHYSSSTMSHQSHSSKICKSNLSSCWLSHSIKPANRVIFLNTDSISSTSTVGAPETIAGHGTRITNQTEASLIIQLLATLLRSGIPPKSIGVITFYRSQLSVLKATARSICGTSTTNDVEMHTADKYQGRDKEVILLSCVRSNDSQHVGELLKDWRRVNVALTRAKSKLVMIGSLSTLAGSGVLVLEGLSRILEEKNWVFNLSEDVLESHRFEGIPTQTQPRSRMSQPPIMRGGISNGQDPLKAKTRAPQFEKRTPLASISSNVRPGMRQPDKVVKGGLSVDKFLDRHPVARNVMDNVIVIDDDDDDDELVGIDDFLMV